MTRGDKVDNVRRISVQGRLNQDRQVETGSFSSPSRLSASSALSLLPASVPNRLAIGAEDVRHGCNCKTHEESFRYQPAPVLVQPSPRLFPCHSPFLLSLRSIRNDSDGERVKGSQGEDNGTFRILFPGFRSWRVPLSHRFTHFTSVSLHSSHPPPSSGLRPPGNPGR